MEKGKNILCVALGVALGFATTMSDFEIRSPFTALLSMLDGIAWSSIETTRWLEVLSLRSTGFQGFRVN